MRSFSRKLQKVRGARRWVAFVAVGILAFLGPIAWLLLRDAPTTEAAWFDGNWSYRQRLSFTNSGAAVTNQKVKFDVDTAALVTAGTIQSDCDDLRFTDIGGKTLQYYIDTSGGACNTSSTDVYVLFPSIIAGENIAYMYYGNPAATAGTQAAQFDQTTFSPGAGPSFATAEQSPGPIAYWKFDEANGQNLRDTQTTRLHATFGSSTSIESIDPTWISSDQCISGSCIRFDGTDDYARIGNVTPLKTASKTISFWARPTKTISVTTPLFSANGTANYYVGFSSSSGMIISYSNSTPAQVTCTTSASTVPVNEWHHYSYTFSVSGSNVTVSMYKDGKLLNSCAAATGYSGTYGTNFIMGTFATNSLFFQGDMDEVKFYNYSLSETQIRSDFLQGASGMGRAAQVGLNQEFLSEGLIGYWKMDEGSWNGTASEVVDASGLGNHGVRSGDATTALGKFGTAGTFDGTGDYVTATSYPTFTNGVTY